MPSTAYNTIVNLIGELSKEEKFDLGVLLKKENKREKYKAGQLLLAKVNGKQRHGIIVGGGQTAKVWYPWLCRDQTECYKTPWEAILKSYDETFGLRFKMPTETTMLVLAERFKDESSLTNG